MSCKHLGKAVTTHKGRRMFDAHVRRGDVDLLRRFLDPNGYLATYDIVGDGFEVRFRKGANGAVLVTIEER